MAYFAEQTPSWRPRDSRKGRDKVVEVFKFRSGDETKITKNGKWKLIPRFHRALQTGLLLRIVVAQC